MILYVATTNPGKLRDFAAAATSGVAIAPLPNIASINAPEETADTFAGNALIKAIAYSAIAPGEIVLADDSGIELDALGGAPGVRSARYADDEGFPATAGLSPDQRNLACLLDRAKNLTGPDRHARYRCVLVAARDGQVLATGTGDVEGILLDTPTGNGGFGYDPIFLISEHDETMAELDIETRLLLSHRGRALADLLMKMKLRLKPIPC